VGSGRLIWSTVGVSTLLVVFYGSRIGFGPIIDRFLDLNPEASRLDFWRDSLTIIAQHPLGIGPMALPSVFKVYDVSSQLVDKTVYQLHNDVLQILVDTGWIGFVSMVGGFFLLHASQLAPSALIGSKPQPVAIFYGRRGLERLERLAFHSFFDFNLQIPANCLYFVTLMAIVHHSTGAPVPRPKRTPRTRQASAA
jgi:O-antigen ligase